MVQLVSPSGRRTEVLPAGLFGCLVVCFVCLFVCVTDRQLVSVQRLTHESSLNVFSEKSCKWRGNYTVQSLSGHSQIWRVLEKLTMWNL